MGEINILHLSDIHFRKDMEGKYPPYPEEVGRWMIDRINQHVGENEGKPDVVAVTGDIAFSGKEPEYGQAVTFFKSLKSVLPADTPILPVPGNHDVDRQKVDDLFKLHDIVENGKSDLFLKDREKIKLYVNRKLAAYYEFVNQINPGLYGSAGDYYWVKDFKDKEVSILGLNSAWASEGDNEYQKIALGCRQLTGALGRAKAPHKILLLHHPLSDWLELRDINECKKEILKTCRLLLHGHNHQDAALVLVDPDHAFISLGANASYTTEKDGFIGYQFLRVQFQNEGCRVRVWPYRYEKDRREFAPHRERWRNQKGKAYFDIHSFEPVSAEGRKIRKPLKIPEEYRDWIVEFHYNLSIEQLAQKGETFTVPLPRVYIPLDTANPFYKEEMELAGKKKGEAEEPARIDIEKLLGRRNFILLKGSAGMGKTTLVKHLAYTVSHGTGETSLKGYLPVPVFLKDLWPLYEEGIKGNRGGVKFEALLPGYFEKTACPLEMKVVADYLAQNRALFLLDGLDEVPEHLRPHLVEVFSAFRFKHKGNRFLLTGRPHGVEGKAGERFGKYLQEIEPLDQPKIRQFIADWFREICGRATGVADRTAGEMIADVSLNEYVSVFTENPLLLTAVCILYQDNKRLPEQRADLYGRVVANLLYKRFLDPNDADKLYNFELYLMRLAFHLQARNVRVFEESEAKEVLQQVFLAREGEDLSAYRHRLDRLFEEIEPHCGLLKRQSGGALEFFHLSFQAFMAARCMVDRGIDFRVYLDNDWWQEAILLYVGLKGLASTDEGNKLVREIMGRGDQVLGARALTDMVSARRDPDTVTLARNRMKELMASHQEPETRLEAGEILGTLGDDRFRDHEMVKVEAGPFTRGSKEGEGYDFERPAREIYLDAFEIGKYPVTNREFKGFVDDGGYKKEEFWTPEGWQWREKEKILEPKYWHDRQWNGPNFPVVGISWFEADAFCKWLSHKTGKQYRLPSEAEWEKAARGKDRRAYPWGNKFGEKKCNSGELGLGRTSPVGIFPEGKSPYECLDMAGNVLEWCLDWFSGSYYEKSPDRNPQGPLEGALRVLRGGSWIYLADYCRSAYRLTLVPAYRDLSFGLRLLCAR